MGGPEAILATARRAYEQRRWDAAREGFAALADRSALTADDLAALADCAWWSGRVDESVAAGARACRAYRREGRPRQAAMAAVGVAVVLLIRGDDASGAGWLGHARELLADEPECVEQGYLAYLLEVEGALDAPDQEAVLAAARRIRDLGRRLGDATLVAAGLLGEGRVLVRGGQVRDGMARFDEAMVHVLGGDVMPDWAGNIYCHLMSASHELGDLRRARSWVRATSRWLETLPVAALFTGICRVHRSQVLQATGDWERSEAEAARVCADLAGIACLTVAEGHYQLGELARLRGRPAAAEEAYRRAHRLGRDPQPGLSLLRLQQQRPDVAAAGIRTALLAESTNRLARARLQAAHAEIALTAGDLAAAETAVRELEGTAERYDSPAFAAAALEWRGALSLARGRPDQALAPLAAARRAWDELRAVHDCARVRVQLARAHQELGDPDTAAWELDAATSVFDRLGAVPDAAAATALRGAQVLPGGLTSREAEVLACLAAGRSNVQIADALGISPKTVARHLSNIFTKLDVPTRTAAAAWAHRHGLGGPDDPSRDAPGWVVRPMKGSPPRS